MQRSIEYGYDYLVNSYLCAKCGRQIILLLNRFRPPKKDNKGWEVVEFLIKNGLPFQHIYQEGSSDYSKKLTDNYVPYPKNMRDAKDFVSKYKERALNCSNC